MAVTTSVFPNLNTFRLGPEFCILFRKLISTCKTHKRATLSERYPDLCQIIEVNAKNVCQKNSNEHGSGVRIIFQFYCSPNTTSNFLTANQRYTYRVLKTIQMKLILLYVWAERAILGRAKTALRFKNEI